VNLGVVLEKLASWLVKQVYLFMKFLYGKENHIIGRGSGVGVSCHEFL
jgi:hypothetical protein